MKSMFIALGIVMLAAGTSHAEKSSRLSSHLDIEGMASSGKHKLLYTAPAMCNSTDYSTQFTVLNRSKREQYVTVFFYDWEGNVKCVAAEAVPPGNLYGFGTQALTGVPLYTDILAYDVDSPDDPCGTNNAEGGYTEIWSTTRKVQVDSYLFNHNTQDLSQTALIKGKNPNKGYE